MVQNQVSPTDGADVAHVRKVDPTQKAGHIVEWMDLRKKNHALMVGVVHSMIFLSLLLLLDNKVLTTWSSVAMCKPDL